MALTPEQKTARLTERINRNREEIKRLERQKAQTKRAERNHRLIVSAATIEAVASERGYGQFEIGESVARKMAEAYFDSLEGGNRAASSPTEGLGPQ